jgi:hypothetical protein
MAAQTTADDLEIAQADVNCPCVHYRLVIEDKYGFRYKCDDRVYVGREDAFGRIDDIDSGGATVELDSGRTVTDVEPDDLLREQHTDAELACFCFEPSSIEELNTLLAERIE